MGWACAAGAGLDPNPQDERGERDWLVEQGERGVGSGRGEESYRCCGAAAVEMGKRWWGELSGGRLLDREPRCTRRGGEGISCASPMKETSTV